MVGPIAIILTLTLLILVIAGMWKVYEKAGHPGWTCIIPIYNVYIMTQIAGRPGWWVVLMIIPYVSFVIAIIIGIDIAKKFGKGTGFGVGLGLLSFIFYPILGFGDAVYEGGDNMPDSEELLDA